MITELRKLQLTELYIFLEMQRLCETHHIHYFLVGGTLLGAVRHCGFIPWDDDIDIGMLRDDYNKFIDICSTDLSGDFFLESRDTMKNYADVIIKLRLNGTKYVQKHLENVDKSSGVSIEIHPYDKIPLNRIKQCVYYYESWFLRGLWAAKNLGKIVNNDRSFVKIFGWNICKMISRCFSKEKLSKKIDEHFQKYKYMDTKYITSPAGMYHYKKETYTRDKFDNLFFLDFEGVPVTVPKAYDEYLTNIYGDDYMELPPIEKRIQHPIALLDLGKYTNIEQILKGIKKNIDCKIQK